MEDNIENRRIVGIILAVLVIIGIVWYIVKDGPVKTDLFPTITSIEKTVPTPDAKDASPTDTTPDFKGA